MHKKEYKNLTTSNTSMDSNNNVSESEMKEASSDGHVNIEHITTDEVEAPKEENTKGINKEKQIQVCTVQNGLTDLTYKSKMTNVIDQRPLQVVTVAEGRFPPDFIQKQVWQIERDTRHENMVGKWLVQIRNHIQ